MSSLPLILFGLYGLFLSWHRRWRVRPVTPAEVDVAFARHDDTAMPPDERARFRAFMESDDGKPFFMVNLMQLRTNALYPAGLHPEVKSARDAHRLYGRMVIRQLLRRGSYPVLLSRKIGSFVDAGPGTDFFDEVAIVRYRSRRDMLAMISDPVYIAGLPHKWAALEKTVIVPVKKLILLDLGLWVPLVLLLVYAAAGTRSV